MGERQAAILLAIALLAAACGDDAEIRSAPQSADGPTATEPHAPVDRITTAESSPTGAAPGDRPSSDDDEVDEDEVDEAGGNPQPTGAGFSGDFEYGGPWSPDPATISDEASSRGMAPAARGDSGDEVLALQTRLAELGFAPGRPDGSYGARTERAIEAFQGLVDLEQTGEADAATVRALAWYRYDGLMLHSGDEGDDVENLQQRLSDGPFDPGSIDGVYGAGTVQAVWALEKLAGIPVDGDWGPLDEKAWELLLAGEIGRPEKRHDERWVEVDLSQQILKVYDPDATTPTLISHASSGSGIPWSNEEHSGSSITPKGDFEIKRRIRGWRESSLNIGRLYNPLYFNGGIAFHGATSVPLYPASHGCVRLPMHVAEYLPDELPNGTPVHVLG